MINLLYCVPVLIVALFNEYVVRQNTHKDLAFDSSIFNSEIFDLYSQYFSIVNVILWIGIIILGIYLETYWWLFVPISIYISYQLGIKRALQTELKFLQVLESEGKLKDLFGNSETALEVLEYKMQSSKKRALGGF